MAEALERAALLEDGLRASGLLVAPQSQLRLRLNRIGSVAPEGPDESQLKAARDHLDQAMRLLALGRLRDAKVELSAIESLPDAALDTLRRSEGDAQQLFDVCIVAAFQHEQAGEREVALHRMQRCAEQAPMVLAAPKDHAKEVRERYAQVVGGLAPRGVARLTVQTSGDRCLARVNGVALGRTPITLELLPVSARLQIECGQGPGRIHSLRLQPGSQTIDVQATLERSLVVDPPRMRLLYANAADRNAHAPAAMRELARALHAGELVVVDVGTETIVHRLDVSGVEQGARARDAPAYEAHAREELIAALWPRPSQTSAAHGPRSQSALRLLPWNDTTAWLVPTTIALGYGLTIASSVYSLSARADVRKNALVASDFDIGAYRRHLNLGIAGSALGAGLATTMELIGLPAEPSIPWWAFVTGGVGLAAFGAGLAIAPHSECAHMTPLRACTAVREDPLVRPLLIIASVPLLTLPFTYALSRAFGIGTSVDVQQQGARLRISGRF